MQSSALRLGVIGTGSVVREIYQYLYFRSLYSGGIRIEAVCDTSPQALSTFADAWKIPENRKFAGYTDMIRSVELDAVAVNTRTACTASQPSTPCGPAWT